nr:MAG TPA: hypothetical protein [Caudoviricetes sp.]
MNNGFKSRHKARNFYKTIRKLLTANVPFNC